jgi:Flp pilus assembly protein CpaB
MSWTIVVAKATVQAADSKTADSVGAKLALALRNAADVVQAENYDVTIHVDGAVVAEEDVRGGIHAQPQKPQEAA